MGVIFVSGIHGAGKSTLIENIVTQDKNFEKLLLDLNFLKMCKTIDKMTIFESCLIRLYHRFYIAQCAYEYKTKSENGTLLVDRGIYDSIAYINAERRIGQLTAEEYSALMEIASNALNIIKPQTVILNPSVETVIQRLNYRNCVGSRKERNIISSREDAVEYVTIVKEEFEKLCTECKLFVIRDNDSESINYLKNWVNNAEY